MRLIICTTIILLSGSVSAFADDSADFNWDAWRYLPVQDGGRYKPFDTLAWETARLLGNRTAVADPESSDKLNSVALYLTMLFQWEGQSNPSPHMPPTLDYFQSHQPDKWDEAQLLRIDFLELRKALGLPEDQKYISPLKLSKSAFHDAQTGQDIPLLQKAQQLIGRRQQQTSVLDQKLMQLVDAYWTYEDIRMGKNLHLIPVKGSEHELWISVEQFLQTKFDDSNDPDGLLRKTQEQFSTVREAFRDKDPKQFNAASATLLVTLRELGSQQGTYPSQTFISLEVTYNRWVPFRIAWIFTSLAFILSLFGIGSGLRIFNRLALVSCVAGLLAIVTGFAMRIAISGFAPVTNMFESVVYLGLGTTVFGLIFECFYRKGYILTAAMAVATVALILADNCPAVLDPAIRPLQPVLRNNFWLIVHVMTITLSYAAFALALGIGNITLAYYLVRSNNSEAITALSNFTYRVLQVGVLLLAIGTILGAVWAEYSWGRFWGWDPKEVWALIALLGYLAMLHARFAGWIGSLGLAASSVVCFTLVLMAWYGVNYLLGAGLHSYGFGGGGQQYVFTALAIQFLYVAAALLRASLNTDSNLLAPDAELASR